MTFAHKTQIGAIEAGPFSKEFDKCDKNGRNFFVTIFELVSKNGQLPESDEDLKSLILDIQDVDVDGFEPEYLQSLHFATMAGNIAQLREELEIVYQATQAA